MAVTVKKLGVWRRDLKDKVGALAAVLEPLAQAGSDLQMVVGYSGQGGKAAVQLFPVKGRKSIAAAREAGLAAASATALMVEGDNKPGLGHAITRAVADAEVRRRVRLRGSDRSGQGGRDHQESGGDETRGQGCREAGRQQQREIRRQAGAEESSCPEARRRQSQVAVRPGPAFRVEARTRPRRTPDPNARFLPGLVMPVDNYIRIC